jgi:hypothetical protein
MVLPGLGPTAVGTVFISTGTEAVHRPRLVVTALTPSVVTRR